MGKNQKAESGGLIAALICGLCSYIGLLVYFRHSTRQWVVAGDRYGVSALAIALCAVVCFAVGYIRMAGSWSIRIGWFVPLRKTLEVIALSFVYGSTVFYMCLAALHVAGTMLETPLTGGYLLSADVVASAVFGYTGYSQGNLLNAKVIAMFLPLFVGSSSLVAMLTTPDKTWWKYNFSSLANNTSFSGTTFNTMLVLTGICIIIISYFAVDELRRSHEQYLQWYERHFGELPSEVSDFEKRQRKHRGERKKSSQLSEASGTAIATASVAPSASSVEVAQAQNEQKDSSDAQPTALEQAAAADIPAENQAEWYAYMSRGTARAIKHFHARTTCLLVLLIITGICLSCVGIFRYGPHPQIHNFVARSMVLPMFILLGGLSWFAPQLSTALDVFSWIVIVITTGSLGMWLNGTVPLTTTEAVAAGLFLVWFIVFSRQIAALQSDRVYTELMYSDMKPLTK